MLAIARALNREGGKGAALENLPSMYVNTLMVPCDGTVPVDEAVLLGLGVDTVIYVPSHRDARGKHMFDADKLLLSLRALFIRLGLESYE